MAGNRSKKRRGKNRKAPSRAVTPRSPGAAPRQKTEEKQVLEIGQNQETEGPQPFALMEPSAVGEKMPAELSQPGKRQEELPGGGSEGKGSVRGGVEASQKRDVGLSAVMGHLRIRISKAALKVRSAFRAVLRWLFHALGHLIYIFRKVFFTLGKVFSGIWRKIAKPLRLLFSPLYHLMLLLGGACLRFLDLLKAHLPMLKKKKDLPALNPAEQRRLQELREAQISGLSTETDLDSGLTYEEAAERADLGLSNVPVEGEQVTFGSIVRENVFTYFNLIFAVITVLLILVGSYKDLAYVLVVVANTAIGITQEWISKKTLDKISILNAPRAQVLREGKVIQSPVADLVRDDLVILGAGKQVPADALLLQGEISVNESLITGEQTEVRKGPGDRILSGSYVVSGSCKCRLTEVGESSFASKLTLEARKLKHEENSEMIRSLNSLVRFIGIAIIPIGLLLFWKMVFVNNMPLRDGVSSTVAAVIGMIPEGLYLLASVTMAASVARLALNQVLVHDMRSIETLARVDVLCVDKTGTITESEISIAGIALLDEDSNDDVRIHTLISDYVAAQSIDNATMKALRSYFHNPSGRRADRRIPFSPEYRYSAAVFGQKTLICGAPEALLLSDMEKYRRKIEDLSLDGKRVMVFGVMDRALEKGHPLEISEKIQPLCLVIAENPVRKNARKTFAFFEEQNVSVKVISGDNPLTVSRIALDAGIKDADLYVDATTLLTDEELDESVDRYTVFGRVTPEQKQALIGAYQKRGLKVAMTGDGVNDVLALKDADCSIAMASGAQAAAHAAQMVLLDSDFARMPQVLSEGRRVVNNIQRTATLFLVKNIFSFLMSLFSIIFSYNYPLRPTQVALVSCFTIGVPAFLLSFEPNRRKISGNFMRNVLFRAFPAGITDFLMICGISFFADLFLVKTGDLSTCCTILLLVVGLMILYRVMAPMNSMHWVIELGMPLCFIFCALVMPELFQLSPLTREGAVLTVLFAVNAEPCLRYLSLLFDYLNGLFHTLWNKLKESDYLMQI